MPTGNMISECYGRIFMIFLVIIFLNPFSLSAAEGIVYAFHFQIPSVEGEDDYSPASNFVTKIYLLDMETSKTREIFSDEKLPIKLTYGHNGMISSTTNTNGMIRIASGHCYAIGFSKGGGELDSDFRIFELQLDGTNHFREIGETQTYYPTPNPAVKYHAPPE